jgi:hypothetical protein
MATATNKTDTKESNLFRSLGGKVSNIYDLEAAAMQPLQPGEKREKFSYPMLPPGQFRTHVFQVEPAKPDKPVEKFVMTIDLPAIVALPPRLSSLPASTASPTTPIFETNAGSGVFQVGFDIEYQEFDPAWDLDSCEKVAPPTKLLSHQFWFNFEGVRFGVVFQTECRFTQRQFVDLLDAVVPHILIPLSAGSLNQPAVKIKKRTIMVWSYYSVVESGWMHEGRPQEKVIKRKFDNDLLKRFYDGDDVESKKSVPWIRERDKEWYGYCPIHGGTANLFFADAINLRKGGLSGLGKEIGIPKVEHDYIERMEWYRDNFPIEFTEYAIIDSVIAAEAHLYYRWMTNELTGVDVSKTRITGYSAEVFKDIFKRKFGDDWKLLLGYEKVGRRTVPTNMHKLYTKHYHGGRNDVLQVGPADECHYLDLHSAYLTSVVMINDYDFSKHIMWSNEQAEERVELLLKQGPFLPFGVTCSFRFKDEIVDKKTGLKHKVYPIFPVRVDDPDSMPGANKHYVTDGLLFPKTGHTSLTWPEFWVAKRMGLLDKVIVHELIEFEPVKVDGISTHHLSDEVLVMLGKRAKGLECEKIFIKALLNYFYGKTAQGISTASAIIKSHDSEKRIDASVMSCYPLASYITGFCRATVGELLQLNHAYGITTDGFITQVPREKLITGDFCKAVEKKVVIYDDKGELKPFIGSEASGDKCLFTKTRGYMILQDGVPLKIAAQGAQVRDDGKYTVKSVVMFCEQLQAGFGDKGYWPKLSQVREFQKKDKNFVPNRIVKPNIKIDMTFDMKQHPINPALKDFVFNGVAYPFISFKTQPLETAMDFHMLRTLSKRRDPLRRYRENLQHWCNVFNKHFEKLRFYALSIRHDLIRLAANKRQDGKDYIRITGATVHSHKILAYHELWERMRSEQTLPKFTKVADFEPIVELQKECKVHIPYMELTDYVELLADYDKYRNGKLFSPENYVLPGFTGDFEEESI